VNAAPAPGDSGRDRIILSAGRQLAEQGFRGDPHDLGAAWYTLRLKGIHPFEVPKELEKLFSGARKGSIGWLWAYESAPVRHHPRSAYATALYAEVAAAKRGLQPIPAEKLRRIYYGTPTERRGRPHKRPDPARLIKACRRRGIELPWQRLLSASELEQLRAFLEGASDEELAARWRIKEVSVRSRRSRLGAKLQQIITKWMEVNMNAPTLVGRVSDHDLRLTALEERYEEQKSQIAELAREIGREFDDQLVSAAVEHFLGNL
jgi:hypothetical protein